MLRSGTAGRPCPSLSHRASFHGSLSWPLTKTSPSTPRLVLKTSSELFTRLTVLQKMRASFILETVDAKNARLRIYA